MNQTQERLQDIEKNGYQLDFGDVFNHAFENYKKIALYAGLVLFVFLVLLSLFIFGSLIMSLGIATITHEFNPEKLKIENFSETKLLVFAGASLLIGCVLAPFNASFFKMAVCGDKDEEFHISDLFSYYKLPYVIEILSSTFIISAISFGQSILMNYINMSFLGTLIQWFISFVCILSIPLIIFGNLKAIEAIKYSIIVVFKQPIVILGLLVVALIGTLVGLLGCCVGMFFTIPFFYSMVYAIYSAAVGLDVKQEIEN